jgi:hypothetical protein
MKDPLREFDWSRLYERYDALCGRFNSSVAHLRGFTPRPQSDRELYYALLRSVHTSSTRRLNLPLDSYEAVLYWKLYSQPAAVANVRRWLGPEACSEEADRLARLISELPIDLQRDATDVTAVVKHLGAYKLAGLKTETALPVRTTLLHFLFPNVVPIFDKMVLQAVGIRDQFANQNISVLRQYLPFAWELAERYGAHFLSFSPETPIRLTDMALWVSRGGCAPRRRQLVTCETGSA